MRAAIALLCLACGSPQSTESATTTVVPGEEPVETHEAPVTEQPVEEQAVPSNVPEPMRALLDAHNRRRAEHCAPPLVWSPELARTAQAWADSLRARNCAFEHSQGNLGENLAGGTSGTLDGESVTEMWYSEGRRFNYRRGGFSMNTGHFTQLVWVGTQRVGCGTAQCNGLDLWVCNYDPSGNFEGEYRENVRPTSCR